MSQRIYELLMGKKEMLDEYFSLCITDEGQVETLPMVLKGYTPNLDRLPHFLLCLGTQVSVHRPLAWFRLMPGQLGGGKGML